MSIRSTDSTSNPPPGSALEVALEVTSNPSPNLDIGEWIRIGPLEEFPQNGSIVVKGIVVFQHEGSLYAVENRCPHMGFPLHLGSVCDGLLTCHWHHARFDVCSGGTLDPWADDVPAHAITVQSGIVYANPRPKQPKGLDWHLHRLREGLEQNLSLIIAKSVVALVNAGVAPNSIAEVGIDFGTSERAAGWGPGLTILTANLNIIGKLDTYGQVLALVQGLVHVARDSAGRPKRHMLQPLPATEFGTPRLQEWYRRSVEVRDTDAAERVLLTVLCGDAGDADVADMMMVAVTDHFYLDGGHTLDFHNKAFEALAAVRPEFRPQVLSSLVPGLGNPTRSEELQNWQTPVDLVSPLFAAFRGLENQLEGTSVATQASGKSDSSTDTSASNVDTSASDTDTSASPMPGQPTPLLPDRQTRTADEQIVDTLLGDDPGVIVETLTALLTSGTRPVHLSGLVALAAAKRIVHFHTQNDFGDWIAVLHTFTNAHAVHERLKQSQNPLATRAIYHVAMRIYLDRFLNIPSAALPKSDAAERFGYSTDLRELLALTDKQQQVAEAATWVAHYIDAGQPMDALWNTLGHLLLREDAEFHSFQMLEAAIKEHEDWEKSARPIAKDAMRTLVLAATRYLAAHAPTARELPQVARIAWRLARGEKLFEK